MLNLYNVEPSVCGRSLIRKTVLMDTSYVNIKKSIQRLWI